MRIGSRSLWLGIHLVGAIVLVACSAASQAGAQDGTDQVGQIVPVEGFGSYVDVMPAELDEAFQAGSFFFVNVHVPNEGEIPGTDTHIAFDQIAGRIGEFPEQVDEVIVLYCRSGSMSAIAARTLVEAGYTNVFNLDGGFRSWIAAGYPFNP